MSGNPHDLCLAHGSPLKEAAGGLMPQVVELQVLALGFPVPPGEDQILGVSIREHPMVPQVLSQLLDCYR